MNDNQNKEAARAGFEAWFGAGKYLGIYEEPMWAAWEAALSSQPAAAPAAGVPEGWKLVPVQPTTEMCVAFYDADSIGDAFLRGYTAMLTASPAAPDVQGGKPAASVNLEDIEQYRLQMAAIGAAAMGYWTESTGIKPEYDSVPLRDVAKLYAKYAALASQAPQTAAAEAVGEYKLTSSIIHKCPALVLPQSFIEKLGNAAQIIPLKGATQEIAEALLAKLNATHPTKDA